MGQGFSKIIINDKTAFSTQTFTVEDYNALNDYINTKQKYNMYEYYFRECMTPLIHRTYNTPCYHFLYGSHGTEYIARRVSNASVIEIKAMGYMDGTRRKKFVSGYTRISTFNSI